MARELLMPKATAVWLVDNTSLSFEQIAEFCRLHKLEVKGIADGDVAQGIRGLDPMTSGQITREEIERGQADPSHRLQLAEPKVEIPEVKSRKGPRYTPLSRRQDRPNAILWLLRNHPELKDSQVIRLVGTTKPTIQAIRERTHWNSANLQPQDPVTLGLCSQIDLDAEVQKAAQRLQREGKTADGKDIVPETLIPTAETIAESGAESSAEPEPEPEPEEVEKELDADSIFAKLKAMKQTLSEETVAEETVAEETVAEETVAEEKVAEETATEETADKETVDEK